MQFSEKPWKMSEKQRYQAGSNHSKKEMFGMFEMPQPTITQQYFFLNIY